MLKFRHKIKLSIDLLQSPDICYSVSPLWGNWYLTCKEDSTHLMKRIVQSEFLPDQLHTGDFADFPFLQIDFIGENERSNAWNYEIIGKCGYPRDRVCKKIETERPTQRASMCRLCFTVSITTAAQEMQRFYQCVILHKYLFYTGLDCVPRTSV